MDVCDSYSVSQLQSVALFPHTTLRSNESTNLTYIYNWKNQENVLLSTNVVGVVGVLSSAFTLPAATVFEAAKIPVITVYTSDHELESKERFPYVFSISKRIPYYEIILALMEEHDWNYVSVVAEQGRYFRNELDKFQKRVESSHSNAFCLATVQEIYSDQAETQVRDVVKNLVEYSKLGANVVVLIASEDVVKTLFTEVDRYKNSTNDSAAEFVWIATETFYCRMKELGAYGNILFIIRDRETFAVPSLLAYICSYWDRKLQAITDPWLKDWWYQLHCPSRSSCNESVRFSLMEKIEKPFSLPIFQYSFFEIMRAVRAVLNSTACENFTITNVSK
jgi:hypothetical protein